MSLPTELIFEIYQNGALIRTERIDREAIKIGSHPKSALFLDDPEVSKVHAVIERNAEGVSIIDLGSGRGTFVNGERSPKRLLHHKDRIKLGNTEILIFMFDERAQQAAQEAKERATDTRTNLPKDEVLYARRFLSRPAQTDGTVEIAMLFNDWVMVDEYYRPPTDIVVGPEEGATYRVEHASIPSNFNLVSVGGGEPSLQFNREMVGEIYVGTERFSLAELVSSGKAKANGGVFSIPLTTDTRARINFAEISFFVHRSTKPTVLLPFFERGTLASVGAMLLSVALHALLMGLMLFMPPQVDNFGLDAFNSNNRFVQLLIEDTIEEEIPPEQEEEAEDDRSAGDEGRAGDEQADDDQGRMAVEGDRPEGAEIELARDMAMQTVQDRGALAVLNQMGPASMFGAGLSGYDAITAIGTVGGNGPVGASYGTGGLGSYGGGYGGGGRNVGGFGAGPIALRGRGPGGGGVGRDLTGIAERGARPISVTVGDGDINGQLDREAVRRVVLEHMREIRACYEEQLKLDPTLEGRVVTRFLVEASGQVASATIAESTLNNQAVESCMTRRIRQWRFPQPRNGQATTVNYPFSLTGG